MQFTATESGFKDGMGGASNAADTKDYDYVLFGRQTDDKHPEYSGVYFEFDDHMNDRRCIWKGHRPPVAVTDGGTHGF